MVEIEPNINVDQKKVTEKLSVSVNTTPPIIAPNALPIASIKEAMAIILPLFSG